MIELVRNVIFAEWTSFFIWERSINNNRKNSQNVCKLRLCSCLSLQWASCMKKMYSNTWFSWLRAIDRWPSINYGDELTTLHLAWQDNSLDERKNCIVIKIFLRHQKVIDRRSHNGVSFQCTLISIVWRFSLIFTGSLIKSKIDSATMLCLKWPASRHFLILIVNKQLSRNLRLSSCRQVN